MTPPPDNFSLITENPHQHFSVIIRLIPHHLEKEPTCIQKMKRGRTTGLWDFAAYYCTAKLKFHSAPALIYFTCSP